MTYVDWCITCDEERYKSTEASNESKLFSEHYCDICGSVGPKYYYQQTIKKGWDDYFKEKILLKTPM
jgi:hypothetical protein